MKRWPVVLVLVLVALCGGVGWWFSSLWAPEPMAPDLAGREAPERRVWASRTQQDYRVSGLVTDFDGSPVEGQGVWARDVWTDQPLAQIETDAEGYFELTLDRPALVLPVPGPFEIQAERVWEATSGLHFVVPIRCPLGVEVVDVDGEPVPDASIRVRVEDPTWGTRAETSLTDETGWGPLDLTLCGPAQVVVQAEGFALRQVDVDTSLLDSLTVTLSQGVLLRGRVVDEQGNPVASGVAQAFSVFPVSSWTDGSFELRVEPGVWKVKVRADDDGVVGYRQWHEELEVGANGLTVDVELESFHRVQVFCAGMPEDRCEGIFPVRCDPGRLPTGRVCRPTEQGGTECHCPLEGAVVRTPEEQVEVLPEDVEVWLDYRDKGAIIGQIVGCRSPAECAVFSGRLAIGATGSPPMRGAMVDPEGHFELRGLDPGTWGLAVGSPAGMLDLPDVDLDEGEVVDLGLIDIGGGGGVAGVVLDGLTGEARRWEAVVVREKGHDSAVNPLGSMAVAGAGGEFRLEGLPSGDYEVFLLKRPLERTSVTVSGSVVDGLVLETAEASVLQEQGFGVDDDLVVNSLDADGWGAEAGLLEGDRVVGVSVMGMDSTTLSPAYSERAAQAALRHYGGPGLDLVVERDGELYDIQLD